MATDHSSHEDDGGIPHLLLDRVPRVLAVLAQASTSGFVRGGRGCGVGDNTGRVGSRDEMCESYKGGWSGRIEVRVRREKRVGGQGISSSRPFASHPDVSHENVVNSRG